MTLHGEIPRVAGGAVAAGAAIGWPFLAFDFMGLAATIVAVGTFITALCGGYTIVRTSQIKTLAAETHAAVNSTATMLKAEATAKELVLMSERDELRRQLDIANAASLAKAEGQLIQQSAVAPVSPVAPSTSPTIAPDVPVEVHVVNPVVPVAIVPPE